MSSLAYRPHASLPVLRCQRQQREPADRRSAAASAQAVGTLARSALTASAARSAKVRFGNCRRNFSANAIIRRPISSLFFAHLSGEFSNASQRKLSFSRYWQIVHLALKCAPEGSASQSMVMTSFTITPCSIASYCEEANPTTAFLTWRRLTTDDAEKAKAAIHYGDLDRTESPTDREACHLRAVSLNSPAGRLSPTSRQARW